LPPSDVIATKRALSRFYISAVDGCQGSAATKAGRAQFAYCFLLGPSPLYFISRVSPSPILDVYDPYDYLIKKKINYTAMLFG
jgi:hypothetical protein